MRYSKNPTAATTTATAALVGLLLLLASSATKAKKDGGVFFSDSFDKHPVGKAPPAPWATTVSKGASIPSVVLIPDHPRSDAASAHLTK